VIRWLLQLPALTGNSPRLQGLRWPIDLLAGRTRTVRSQPRVWLGAPNLALCPKFRKASADKVLEHIKEDKCGRCLAVFHQLDKESLLIGYLSRGRN